MQKVRSPKVTGAKEKSLKNKLVLQPKGKRTKKIVFEANFPKAKNNKNTKEIDNMIAQQLGTFGLFS